MDTGQAPSTPDPLGFQVPTPVAAPPRRPGLLTAAAVVLLVFGAVGLLVGTWLLTGGHGGAVSALHAQARPLRGWFPVLIGGLYLSAGILILRLRPAGRTLGFASGGVMVVTNLLRLRSAPGAGLVGLAVAGFLIYALMAHAPRFTTPSPG